MEITESTPPADSGDHCHMRRNADGTIEIVSAAETFPCSRAALEPLIAMHNQAILAQGGASPDPQLFPPVAHLLNPTHPTPANPEIARFVLSWISTGLQPMGGRVGGSCGPYVCTEFRSNACADLEEFKHLPPGKFRNVETWDKL